MTSRTRNGLEFGSDSFLDIIANIVGILIILIVIAGLRVSRSPVTSADTADSGEPQIVLDDTDTAAHVQPLAMGVDQPHDSDYGLRLPAPAIRSSATAPTARPVLAISVPPHTNDLEARQLQRARHGLDRQLAAIQTETESAAKRAELLDSQRTTHTAALSSAGKDHQSTTRVVAQLESALQDANRQRSRLANALIEAQAQKRPTTAIRHRLTSIGHTVRGDEIHFRVAAGRIAVVPVDILQQRLKAQVMRNKSWLLKFHKHEGYVGPVQGFTMTYVVERQSLSRIEQLRTGGGAIHIGVSRWTIHRQPDLKTESVDEALALEGQFRQTVQLASEATTLTFWVYPDSFEAYRRLRAFAHQLGFTVAGRPLPAGMQISGSPHGSRSSGQ